VKGKGPKRSTRVYSWKDKVGKRSLLGRKSEVMNLFNTSPQSKGLGITIRKIKRIKEGGRSMIRNKISMRVRRRYCRNPHRRGNDRRKGGAYAELLKELGKRIFASTASLVKREEGLC